MTARQPFLYKGLFEAHITLAPLNPEQETLFTSFCQTLGVKAIRIELPKGDVPVQPMTCSVHEGDFPSVLRAVKALSHTLIIEGFSVTRVKIEAAPFNEGIPQDQEGARAHASTNYFEFHLKVWLGQGQDLAPLKAICLRHQAHLSRNAFKQASEGGSERFVTQRAYACGLQEAKSAFERLEADVRKAGMKVLKTVTEYCVFDDNFALDGNWGI